MDTITGSMKAIRSKLNLQPREELIKILEERILKIQEDVNMIAQPHMMQFTIDAANLALTDLQESVTEEILLNRVSEWIQLANNEPDKEKRVVLSQLGAFIMSTKY